MRRKVLEFGLTAAILIAVGGFGGTEPVSWGVSQVVMFLLGLLLVLSPPRNSTIQHKSLLVFPSILAAWVAVQWFGSRSGKIGFDAHSIQARGLTFATGIVAFFVAMEVARHRVSRERFVLCLIGLGVFEALYGFVQYLARWQYIWTVPRRFYTGSATGTYVNHNHYSGLLEMILPLALGLAYYRWQKARDWPRGRSISAVFDRLGDSESKKCFLLLLAAMLMLVAIVFSLSRMGMISLLVSLAVMWAVRWIPERHGRLPGAPLRSVLVLLILAGSVTTVAWVGIGPFVRRFEQLPQNEPLDNGTEGRLALWRDASELVREHPWTGVGLGCFQYAFTRVQTVQLTYVVDHAHNDYLQLAVELGLPCAALVFTIFGWLVCRVLQASLRAHSSLTRSLALGSLGGVIALLTHSAADFNLYIPANILVFAVILGMGYALSLELQAGGASMGIRELPSS